MGYLNQDATHLSIKITDLMALTSSTCKEELGLIHFFGVCPV